MTPRHLHLLGWSTLVPSWAAIAVAIPADGLVGAALALVGVAGTYVAARLFLRASRGGRS